AARQIAACWSERVARPRRCVTTCCSGARSAPSATATGPRSTTADDQTLPEHATCVPPGTATAQIVIGHAPVGPGAAVSLGLRADPEGHASDEDQQEHDRAEDHRGRRR